MSYGGFGGGGAKPTIREKAAPIVIRHPTAGRIYINEPTLASKFLSDLIKLSQTDSGSETNTGPSSKSGSGPQCFDIATPRERPAAPDCDSGGLVSSKMVPTSCLDGDLCLDIATPRERPAGPDCDLGGLVASNLVPPSCLDCDLDGLVSTTAHQLNEVDVVTPMTMEPSFSGPTGPDCDFGGLVPSANLFVEDCADTHQHAEPALSVPTGPDCDFGGLVSSDTAVRFVVVCACSLAIWGCTSAIRIMKVLTMVVAIMGKTIWYYRKSGPSGPSCEVGGMVSSVCCSGGLVASDCDSGGLVASVGEPAGPDCVSADNADGLKLQQMPVCDSCGIQLGPGDPSPSFSEVDPTRECTQCMIEREEMMYESGLWG